MFSREEMLYIPQYITIYYFYGIFMTTDPPTIEHITHQPTYQQSSTYVKIEKNKTYVKIVL